MGTCLSLSLALSGCKPPEGGSTIQSLDNFESQATGGMETDNVCGITYDSTTGRATTSILPKHVRLLVERGFVLAKGKHKDQVLGTLAAVPAPLLTPFVLANGRIEVTKSREAAVRACSAIELTAKERQLTGKSDVATCWTTSPTVRVILPPDSGAIRHSLLRAIAYFYTEVFVDRASRGEKPFDQQAWQRALDSFRDTRAGLRDAFLFDVERRNQAAHAKLTSALSDDQLANYVYAEALDSYYCRPSMAAGQPRATFKSRFPSAWKLFTDAQNPNSPVNLFGR